MLNERLANTALFCGNDIDSILECTAVELADYMEGQERDFLTANEIGRIFLENVEFHLSSSVKDMRKMRG